MHARKYKCFLHEVPRSTTVTPNSLMRSRRACDTYLSSLAPRRAMRAVSGSRVSSFRNRTCNYRPRLSATETECRRSASVITTRREGGGDCLRDRAPRSPLCSREITAKNSGYEIEYFRQTGYFLGVIKDDKYICALPLGARY